VKFFSKQSEKLTQFFSIGIPAPYP